MSEWFNEKYQPIIKTGLSNINQQITNSLIVEIRAKLKAAIDGDARICATGIPEGVPCPWFVLIWEKPGVGWFMRDIRDSHIHIFLL